MKREFVSLFINTFQSYVKKLQEYYKSRTLWRSDNLSVKQAGKSLIVNSLLTIKIKIKNKTSFFLFWKRCVSKDMGR